MGYKITGFTTVMEAIGFLIRWLQSMQIYDEVTGLANATAPVNFWRIGITVITDAVLLVFVLYLRQFTSTEDPKALDERTLAHPIIGIFAGFALVVGGAIMIFVAAASVPCGHRRRGERHSPGHPRGQARQRGPALGLFRFAHGDGLCLDGGGI